MVPCTGLYADVADDSFKQTTLALDQKVMNGKWLQVLLFHPYKSGFNALTREMRDVELGVC